MTKRLLFYTLITFIIYSCSYYDEAKEVQNTLKEKYDIETDDIQVGNRNGTKFLKISVSIETDFESLYYFLLKEFNFLESNEFEIIELVVGEERWELEIIELKRGQNALNGFEKISKPLEMGKKGEIQNRISRAVINQLNSLDSTKYSYFNECFFNAKSISFDKKAYLKLPNEYEGDIMDTAVFFSISSKIETDKVEMILGFPYNSKNDSMVVIYI